MLLVTARTVNDLVRLCENQLGWQPSAGVPMTRARKLAAARLRGYLDEHPNVTVAQLELAVEYLRRQRREIYSPMLLTHVLPQALELAAEQAAPAPLTEQVDQAIAWEHERELPDYRDWIGRLVRARGDGCKDVLADWRQARGLA